MSSALFTLLAVAFYLAASVCYGAVLFLRAPALPSQSATLPHVTRFARPLLILGIVAQFAAIGVWCVTTHRSPFASEYGTMMVSAWAIALTFAVLDIRIPMPAVAAIGVSLACIVLFWGVLLERGPIADSPLLTGQMVSLHVLAILASFGLFAVAFGCAALYLLQNRLLKERHLNALFRRLPPLATLDSVAYHAVAFALPLLTMGLALGFARIFGSGMATPPSRWLVDGKTIASLATWILYVFYLSARLLTGWRGVRLQYILLLGLPCALALYAIPTHTHRFS